MSTRLSGLETTSSSLNRHVEQHQSQFYEDCYWCILPIESKKIYVPMHNAPAELDIDKTAIDIEEDK